ncbi:MAG: SLBB domain-containing protein [Bacteroidetes bacterium]|nr:SLBB domain-containing protein [Bacteroidota bacterium]
MTVNAMHRLRLILLIISLTAVGITGGTAQGLTDSQIQDAKRQLGTMSPDEIDAKIKQYGMTREEAEVKAKAMGIDLETYLNRPAPVPESSLIQIEQGGATVQIKTPMIAPVMSPVDTTPEPVVNLVPPSVALKPKPVELSPAGLPYFGYDLFRTESSSFEPRPYIDDQYILGEGDVLKLSLSGELQSYNEYTVNAEGRISITGIPPVLVAGLTAEKAKKAVMTSLGSVYSGIVRNPPSIFLDLSVARIRPVRIFMTGEVEQPGGYAVSNFGSVFNSLFSVGGPKLSGSLRDIRVVRNNKTIAKVDIYDYLLGAPKVNDVRVNDNDIIFVPLRGKTVSIKGEVLRPYTYELLPGENLKKLVEFSGGFRARVYVDRIQVDRIIPFAERVKGGEDRRLFDIDARDIIVGKKDHVLEDGDIITIFPMIDKKENFVTVEGDVRRPGDYQIDRIKTVKDLIDAAEGLWPTAYMKRAELTRTFPDEKRQLIVLDLSGVMANAATQNIPLQKKDKLRIYNIYELNPAATVTVTGQVKKPGVMPYADSMTVGRLLRSVGGLEDSIFRARTFLGRSDLFRLNDDLITRRRIQVDIGAILDGRQKDIPILAGDQLRVYGLEEVQFLDHYVEIFGNVKRPGRFPLTKGLRLKDLVLLAGGFTEDAWSQRAEIARINKNVHENDSILTITFADLPNLFDTSMSRMEILESQSGSFILYDRDQVFIRPHPDYRVQQQVEVTGYVRFPGIYVISKNNERLSDIISRAGGIAPDGYARGAQLLRNNERIRNNVEGAIDDPGGDFDVIMQAGDKLNVPKKPNTVRVSGEVNNPGLYKFVPGEDRDYYLDRAGDVTDSADFVLVTSPEGHIMKTGFPFLWSDSPEIADGSEITVIKKLPERPKTPEEERRTSFVEVFKESTAIVATTFTILVLANQLK